ncbi:GNAT family N-acetyltransferase [Candidatus Poribacteria bacterium]|nr:GNAT family N-acetyltransferase [Candidatus Poribacteria bacterium]
MEILETKRLILRELILKDIDDLYTLYSDPKVMKFIGTGRPYSYEETEEVLELHLLDYEGYGFGLWAAIFKANQHMIGRCGLEPTETEDGIVGDIAWLFAKEYWGQGLGTECGIALVEHGFEKLGLQRITATAHPDNIASIRIMQKIGMTYDGFDKSKNRVCYSIERKDCR